VSGIVLARLLSPEDYGVFAVALVALNALLSMNELGVSLAVVRWPGDVRRIAPTVTTVSVAASSALYVACFVAAPRLAAALGAPGAAGVLRLLCVHVVVDAVTAVPVGLLTREFRQERRMVADLSGFAASTGVTLLLATGGFGPWSLAWGRLAGSALSAVLFLRLSPERLRLGFDRRQAGELLRFGLPLAGSSLLVFAMLNLDYIVVGRLLGPAQLGLYLLAFNLSSWPVNMFSLAVRRVSLAGFSRLLDDAVALRSAFVRAFSLVLAATAPVCALLAGFALPLIRFVYGARWGQAAAALSFLAVLAALRVVLELAYDLLVALGRSRTILWLQAVWVAALAPALAAGAELGGIRGVGAGHVVVGFVVVAPGFLLVLRRAGIDPGELARGCARPLLGTLFVVATAAVVRRVVPGDLWQLAVGGTVALMGYAAVVWPLRRLLTAGPAAAGPAPAAEAAQQAPLAGVART
jgi:PST family polysaccharide transporter